MKRSVLNFEGASLGDLAFASSWFCKNIFTIVASNNSLGMAEDNISFTASSALHIHKIRIWGGDESFKFMGLFLMFEARVEEVSVHLLKNIMIIFIFSSTCVAYLNLLSNTSSFLCLIFLRPKQNPKFLSNLCFGYN